MAAGNPYSAPGAALESDQKICNSCGAGIKLLAEICPKCGVRQPGLVSKTALLLITFFLGGFGGHKFYLGKWVQGIFYLLFCWSGIPGLIALIEFIVYACTSSQRLNEKYSASGSIAVLLIVGSVVLVMMIGILAAIALPAYQDYTVRAQVSETLNGLTAHKLAVSEYFADKRQLPATGAEIEMPAATVPRTQSVKIARGGVIVATLADGQGAGVSGKAIILVPRANGAELSWTCGVQDAAMTRFMPGSCRTVLPLP